MLAAIGLNDQSCFDAGKINNVGSNWELPPESDAELMVAQFPPQRLLSNGEIAP